MSSTAAIVATAQAGWEQVAQELAATAADFAAQIAAASTAGLTLEPEQTKSFPHETLVSAPALVFDVVQQQKAALLGYTVQADWVIYGIVVYQDGEIKSTRSLEHLQHLGGLAAKPAATYSEVVQAVDIAKESDEITHASFVAGRPAFDMEIIMASCVFEMISEKTTDTAPPELAALEVADETKQVRGYFPLAHLWVRVLLH